MNEHALSDVVEPHPGISGESSSGTDEEFYWDDAFVADTDPAQSNRLSDVPPSPVPNPVEAVVDAEGQPGVAEDADDAFPALSGEHAVFPAVLHVPPTVDIPAAVADTVEIPVAVSETEPVAANESFGEEGNDDAWVDDVVTVEFPVVVVALNADAAGRPDEETSSMASHEGERGDDVQGGEPGGATTVEVAEEQFAQGRHAVADISPYAGRPRTVQEILAEANYRPEVVPASAGEPQRGSREQKAHTFIALVLLLIAGGVAYCAAVSAPDVSVGGLLAVGTLGYAVAALLAALALIVFVIGRTSTEWAAGESVDTGATVRGDRSAEVVALRAEIDDLRAHIADLIDRESSAHQHADTTLALPAAPDAEVVGPSEEIAALQTEIQSLHAKIADLTERLADAAHAVQDAQASAQAQADAARREIEQVQADAAARIAAAEQSVTDQAEDVLLDTSAEEDRRRVEALAATVEHLQAVLDEVRAGHGDIAKAIRQDTAEKVGRAAQERMAAQQSDHAHAVADLVQRVAQAEERAAAAEAALAGHLAAAPPLDVASAPETHAAEVEALSERLAEYAHAVEDLAQRLTQAETDAEAARTALEEASSVVEVPVDEDVPGADRERRRLAVAVTALREEMLQAATGQRAADLDEFTGRILEGLGRLAPGAAAVLPGVPPLPERVVVAPILTAASVTLPSAASSIPVADSADPPKSRRRFRRG